MYIERVPNRSSPPAILLRESFREGSKVRKRTIANLSHLPPERIEALRAALKGETLAGPLDQAFEIIRTRPHGHVAAVVGMLRKLRLEPLLDKRRCPQRDRVVAMIAARVLDPRSKLATARGLNEQTSFSTLADLLHMQDTNEDQLYEAMDWLFERQEHIEAALAQRHLRNGALVLYDVTSTYFEGRTCPRARLGHSRDGKRGKLQIVIGLVCNGEGCPVAVQVFEGNQGDPTTLTAQVDKIRSRFGLEHVVYVGDRGMITDARIRNDLRPHGLDWITSLRAPAIRSLMHSGSLQLSLFDTKDLAEITDAAYPGERLVVCRNPLLAEERARKRRELLDATERELVAIVEATRRPRNRLRGKDRIGLRVGKVLGRFKVGKHFRLDITDTELRYERDELKIGQEAALDGIYVVRTSVPSEMLGTEDTVSAYKSLSRVERAFRSIKTVDLKVRPIHHRLADRVQAHVLLCMLAYYVEWHMRVALAPSLFDDDDRDDAAKSRASVVQRAQRSSSAEHKAITKHTADGTPVHSFRTLLADLATIAKNRIRPTTATQAEFDRITTPTPLQQKAFDLLGIRLYP